MTTKSYLFEKVYLKCYEDIYETKNQLPEIHWSKLWRRYHNFNNQIVCYYDY